jgi:hypothetical protein
MRGKRCLSEGSGACPRRGVSWRVLNLAARLFPERSLGVNASFASPDTFDGVRYIDGGKRCMKGLSGPGQVQAIAGAARRCGADERACARRPGRGCRGRRWSSTCWGL